MNSKAEISIEEARSFLVNYHNLNQARDFKGIDGVIQCFQQIKSIQYDPLDVVGRNADLVLQSRVSGYESSMLYDLLYHQHVLIDGVDKEMCIYVTNEFRNFARIRKASGERAEATLAYRGQSDALNILDEVREYIKLNGLTNNKDLSIGESRASRWGHKKLSSAALDYLYCTGELIVKEKRGVQKYYDFAENVVPKELLKEDDFLSDEDYLEWYIKRRIQCVGLLWNKRGGAWQGHYLSDIKMREKVLNRLIDKGELKMVHIEGMDKPFYFPYEAECFFNSDTDKKYVKFLAPLDNMLWDREMIKRIFKFDYRWEVYTPVDKRKYGYYVLPVLYGTQLVARFEPCKSKKDEPFMIKNWWWEPGVIVTDEMLRQIHHSIKDFARYLSVPSKDTYTNVIMMQKEEL
ncbi:MAG TPA: winged helix DNA-binding domain-containing protein [Lachnospiraceae bacterium]|nr:winged helix DNA-binding domain-containing protein [Lachnospiraceae bacterium]